MARWQFTLILEGFGRGASESFYLETEDDNIATAYARIPMIPQKRADCLGNGWYVKGDRMSMKKNTAGLKVKKPSRVREYFLPGNAAQVCMSLDASYKVLWITQDGMKTKLAYMAGGWEKTNPEQNVFNPEGTTFLTKFNDYTAKLKTAKAGWLSNTSPASVKISGYTFSALTGRTTYTLADDLFVAPFDGKPVKVGVEFPDRRSPLDGPQLVIPESERVCVTLKPRPAMPYAGPGRMRLYVLSFVGVGAQDQGQGGDIVIQKITRRQRGKPLLVSPGRAPVKVLW